MTKADIIRAAAKSTGVKQETVEAILSAALESVTGALASGEPVKIHNFGILEQKQRAERTTYDFHTGEKMRTAAKTTVHFKPAEKLKQRINSAKEGAAR